MWKQLKYLTTGNWSLTYKLHGLAVQVVLDNWSLGGKNWKPPKPNGSPVAETHYDFRENIYKLSLWLPFSVFHWSVSIIALKEPRG